MEYPTPGTYQEALQVPEAAFVDRQLQSATLDTAVLGLPKAITGAFAVVFPMTLPDDRRVAAKCFLREAPDRRRRYRAISQHLSEAALSYTVDFDYQNKGITVEGQTLPLLKMDWVPGQPLNAFIETHLDAPRTLAVLRERFADMLAALAEHDTAHGDLQHGNVLVEEREDRLALRLVDYDTMYVPALAERRSTEVGHRNYQHPDRDERDFGPYLDHFSARVIHTALAALQRDPSLWDRFNTGENLLFCADDFYAPNSSPLFEALTRIEDIKPSVERLRTACYLEPEDVPPLATESMPEAPTAGRPPTPRRSSSSPSSAPRGGLAHFFLPALLVGLGACVGMGALSILPAVGLTSVVLTGAGGIAWRSWRHLPVVRRRRRLQTEITYFEDLLGDLYRQIETRKKQRREVQADVEELRAERLHEVQNRALRDQLKHHFVNEAKKVEGIGHHVVVRLKAAGIRAAHQITPEHLADVRRIGPQSRARVEMWRATLDRKYADAVPEQLSPAEERRLRRSIERRAQRFEDDIERLRAKQAVQEKEKKAVSKRLKHIPRCTLGRYIAYLLRVRNAPHSSGSEATQR